MKIFILATLFLATLQPLFAQSSSERPHCEKRAFDKKVQKLLRHDVPSIDVSELRKCLHEVLLLDARERGEHAVSHLPGARYAGFNDFDLASFGDLPKDTAIVVYCSVGYRSEIIGRQLRQAGFTNVRNLYGSIFEWANRGFPLTTAGGQATRRVHAYDKKWAKWVEKGKAERVY